MLLFCALFPDPEIDRGEGGHSRLAFAGREAKR